MVLGGLRWFAVIRRTLSSRALCPCFSVCFGILVTSLGEEGAGICASRTFVCLFCACMLLSFFSSSWYRGLAAVCDCRIPWTFLLTFFCRKDSRRDTDHVQRRFYSRAKRRLNSVPASILKPRPTSLEFWSSVDTFRVQRRFNLYI